MSLIHPVKKVYITQEWGVNPDKYKKFNLLGHNGIDLRAFLPNGNRCYVGGKSEVFCPHDGKVIENAFDANGYGWYVKIENPKEGSILAHFSSQSPLKVGQTCNQGDFVGYQGTTGNSTAIHLHWGYYPIPRDRSNGYSGTINQLPLIGKGDSMPSTGEDLQKCKNDLEQEKKRTYSARSDRGQMYVALGLAENIMEDPGIEKAIESIEKMKRDLADIEKVCQNQIIQINKARTAFFKQVSPNKKEPIEDYEGVVELINNYKTGKHLDLGQRFSLLINKLFEGWDK